MRGGVGHAQILPLPLEPGVDLVDDVVFHHAHVALGLGMHIPHQLEDRRAVDAVMLC